MKANKINGKKSEIEAKKEASKKRSLEKSEIKRSYEKDKNGWVINRNKKIAKIKLRKFIQFQVRELSFLDLYKTSQEARTILIEKYEKGGVKLVNDFVTSEFLKEVEQSYKEMEVIHEEISSNENKK